jgi:hypothetical protein
MASELETPSVCQEVAMTPVQLNAVIEEKLVHLKPVLECALAELMRTRDAISNGEVSWRKLFDRALSTTRNGA